MQTSRSPHSIQTLKYGPDGGQEGDLHLPLTVRPPVVCLLHGGFWKMPYGRDQFDAVAEDLVERGYAVWNLEYRRLGAPGGGWPGTLQDVRMGIDHLVNLEEDGISLDLSRVSVVGHSAGGHLALWAAARHNPSPLFPAGRIRLFAAIGLAPLADLHHAFRLQLGKGAVEAFLGGSPEEHPDRCAAASPINLAPLGLRHLILHGAQDDLVPLELSERYALAAQAAGDQMDLIPLPIAGHMDFLDPNSQAHATWCDWLARLDADSA
ncbi:S9 family peptidase [Geothrix sp. PMB-07]|uniref:alpha/beta hydrolase family protein n=1 Tax=Geothrix sp. PMB-07 TaxID=3068640 RepID=UPI0027417037|nr:alpha/beta hydrolase [Geothrix sp. PMB-07]WLT31579.1 alpha/beta hydrolase [Geothrix sp. PMB-07]